MKTYCLILIILALTVNYTSARSTIRIPRFFSDNMVVQRNQPVVFWGWAPARKILNITFAGESKKVVADAKGQWLVNFKPREAGGPYTFELKANDDQITLNNILVGDVWICSGQSNMEWKVGISAGAADEIPKANHPTLRHIEITKSVAMEPQQDVATSSWRICSPETVPYFTAVGYYFAKELQHNFNVPIGLIHTSWGGTQVESWISRDAFENHPHFKDMIAALPSVDLKEIKKMNEARARNTVLKHQSTLIASSAEAESWKTIDFDDKNWPSMTLPGLWEAGPLPNIDGKVWLRKEFILNKEDTEQAATLYVGKIDDSDITYINGVQVGTTLNRYNQERVYAVPANILQEGKNVIAVKVEDTGGGGGISGQANTLKLSVGDKSLPLRGEWKFQVETLALNAAEIGPNEYPTVLYNAMIHPLTRLPIKGALWYQGETNASRAYEYRTSFPLMIENWRLKWKNNFPFYFVQLTSFNADNGNSNRGSEWAELREAQALTKSAVQNTGMIVTIDIGDPDDIHPLNKQDVGKRLASLALKNTYQKDIIAEGPVFKTMKIENSSVTVMFDNIGTGLHVKDKYGYVKGFEVAGEDQVFHYAKAEIVDNAIVLQSKDVVRPVAIRYAWADDASDCNLYNKEGLPAAPFRTDNWKAITSEKRFTVH